VQIDGQVLLKVLKHCKECMPSLVTGQLLGLDIGSTLEVTNAFPFPVCVPQQQQQALFLLHDPEVNKKPELLTRAMACWPVSPLSQSIPICSTKPPPSLPPPFWW
jgi:hypothetical protein